MVQFTVYYLTQKKLNEPGLLPYLLFFDIFSPLINGILFLSNTGRQIRQEQMEVSQGLSEKARSDLQLVEQAKLGSEKAFATLMNRYRDSIYYHAS